MRALPKSLHTVTVLCAIATAHVFTMAHLQQGVTAEQAVTFAINQLELSGLDDVYGLQAQAISKLHKLGYK